MRTCAGRLLGTVVLVLVGFACADGAAPPVQSRPLKPWTGTIDVSKGQVCGMAFSADGNTLVTGGEQKVALWDLRTGKLIVERLWEDKYTYGKQVAFVNGEKEIACLVGGAQCLHILDRKTLETRTELVWQKGESLTDCFAVSPDGKQIAGGARDSALVLWQAASGKLLWKHDFEKKKTLLIIRRLAFSPDGKTIAAGVDDEEVVRLHDARTGRELRRIANPEARSLGGVTALAYSPDGRSLAAGFRWESIIRIWDPATGKQVRCIEWEPKAKRDPGEGVYSLTFSPDGKTLAAGCRDEHVRLYEVATGGLRHTQEGCGATFCWRGQLLWEDRPKLGRVHVRQWPPRRTARRRRLTDEALGKFWDALGSRHAGAAFEAMTALLAAPEQALALLERLPRVEPLTDKQVARLIAGLDDDDPEVREKATEDLKHAGTRAEKALRAALAKPPSAEVKKRAAAILKNLTPLRPERLRFLRSVEVLEALATPEAQQQLERLAGGAAGVEETEDARAALRRARKRLR